MNRKRRAPRITFDGYLYWYMERFDPSDDRCSRCREEMTDGNEPLILFKNVGQGTWQARICDTCTPGVVQLLQRSARNQTPSLAKEEDKSDGAD